MEKPVGKKALSSIAIKAGDIPKGKIDEKVAGFVASLRKN
jgi:hypothetical protein